MNQITRILRVIDCFRQSNSLTATQVSLTGQRFLVTGGSSGIGAETVRTLSAWGAEVIIACRSQAKGARLVEQIAASNPQAQVNVLSGADTSDLDSMQQLAERVIATGKPLDGLILNAGIAERPYALSKQGFELHAATNVLGHHLLTRRLLPIMRDTGRIVSVTGDIYILIDDCTLDYKYSYLGRTYAYSRSKLGIFWNALTLHALRAELGKPNLRSIAIHPGVVSSNLFPGFDGLKARLFITPEQGAQTTIAAASDPELASGAYLHNTRGVVTLPSDDPALNDARRRAFWADCEQAVAAYLV